MKVMMAVGLAIAFNGLCVFVAALTEVFWGWDGERVGHMLLGAVLAILFLEYLELKEEK